MSVNLSAVGVLSRVRSGFGFMLASRGWRRGVHRTSLILRRFGLGTRRMAGNLRAMHDVLETHGASATLFVPATVLRDHRRVLAPFLASPRIEWGVHSDYHTDLSRMEPAEQASHLENAVRLFVQAGVPFTGFRAPYLKTNGQTARLLEDLGGFVYDSSPCVLWDEVYPPSAPSYGFVREFYRPRLHSETSSSVEAADGLVRIPVSLPDDDILVDRDRLAPRAVLATWRAALDAAHAAGEIFVLQLHPERGRELAGVLGALLGRAREHSMWVTTLAEVAARHRAGEVGWPSPHRSAFCVTGDLDAMAVADFASRLKTW
ncbi:MAG: polysaccharide deacetylase family protein [Acidobacteriota bacterium]